ncbi:flagellar protein FliT [Solimicrobium silvestre]|uniref:Flagellar protein FliT n=1 Tax=Solimicrobium silvestre TaxID=2099400 RepID=A0A2S9GUV6_9BURK|nr:flagellar protein FliT [Solimicrobium silvestre]PRC91491.1 Flagellar protein FliT [Solimicrobium silvestre]
MTSQELMTIYENVASLTDQMVGAAQSNNWTLLAKLEEKCSLQVQAIKDNDVPVVLANEQREKKVCVINKILADDRKIRDITEPRMAQLSELMKSSSSQRKLFRAYQLDHRRA